MNISEAIRILKERSKPVPNPARLPSNTEVEEIEKYLGLRLPSEFRQFLLEGSGVTVGTLELATITDKNSHTYLLSIIEAARDYGVPNSLLPFCEDNSNYYCLTNTGVVKYWPHDGTNEESWPTFAIWVRDVWLGEHA